MRSTTLVAVFVVLTPVLVLSQTGSINNTLGSAGVFRVRSSSSDSLLVVRENGRVGIGTSSPSTLLEVAGSIGVPSSSRYTYTSPRSRSIVYGNASFIAVGVEGQTGTRNVVSVPGVPVSVYVAPPSSSQVNFAAPVDLPDGATITELSAYIFDTNATYDVTVLLTRQAFGTLSVDSLTGIASSGAPGATTYSTSSVANGTIDKGAYSYQIVYQNRVGGNHAMMQVKLTYTVDAVE